MQVSNDRVCMSLSPPAHDLVWEDWGDIYTVYQRSSAETHVFNETTAFVLNELLANATTLNRLIDVTMEAMGLKESELVARDLTWAAKRLEELGLIELRSEAALGS